MNVFADNVVRISDVLREKGNATATLYREVIEAAPDAVLLVDQAGKICLANRMVEKLFGYLSEELIGKTVECLLPAENRTGHVSLRKSYNSNASTRPMGAQQDLFAQRKDGTKFPVEISLSPIQLAANHSIVAAIIRDVTERRKTQAEFARLAQFDDLTDLPNRRFFKDRLEASISRARRHHSRLALLFIDVDNFKDINDSLGHDAGDSVLQALAERFRSCVRMEDTLARLGGDEFTLLIEDLDGTDEASQIAEKLLKVSNNPLHVRGQELDPGISIGIAVFPDSGTNVRDLLKNADTALYHAKADGRNIYRFYQESMTIEAQQRLTTLVMLNRALPGDEFELHYQTQMNLPNLQVTGVEALLRWRQPDIGLLLPGRFINVLEKSPLMEHVGKWVIKTACRQFRAWLDQGIAPVRMSVNVSPGQIHGGYLPMYIAGMLEQFRLPAECLQLEITERVLLEHTRKSIDVLNQLKEIGVRLCIDDFGTAYASLNYLRRLPLDSLKLDTSLVRDVTSDRTSEKIVRAVISLAHSLGLSVVAEGVEQQNQVQFLTSENCDEVQGFLLSRPAPAGLCRFGNRHHITDRSVIQ